VTAWCVYWLYAAGWPVLHAGIARGDGAGVLWALLAVFGLGALVLGLRESLFHTDALDGLSLLWSAIVITLCVFALRDGWFLEAAGYDVCRAFWYGWLASNAVNLWLQLRGMRRRDEPATAPAFGFFFARRRQTTISWSEEIKMQGTAPPPAMAPVRSSPVSERRAPPPPEIVYVKEGDAFVPMRLPAEIEHAAVKSDVP
jgi:hypothetical protein